MDSLIRLACGTFTLVDDVWYDKLSETRWRLSHGYAIGPDGARMHRVVMQARDGQIVDHINRDKLDNRQSNLRFVTHEQNAWNRPKLGRETPYKGVSKSGYTNRPWRAEIKVSGQRYDLGCYAAADHAAFVYDLVAAAKLGKYAVLNDVRRTNDFSFAQNRIARKIERLTGMRLADEITAAEIEAIRQRLSCRTITEFARLLGFDPSSVGDWLSGVSRPTPKSLARIRDVERDLVS